MPKRQHNQQFLIGAGQAPEEETFGCADCGYTHTKKKLFKQSENGLTCSTGHYEDKQGQVKRARNPYARH